MAAARSPSLRPYGSDDLGLRRALSDRLLPLLVAAMAFLAAIAGAGAVAASGLAAHWQGGAASLVTVQVPQPLDDAPGHHEGGRASGARRQEAVAAVLARMPQASVRQLGETEVASLLQPWLGDDAARLSMLLPAVFELRVADDSKDSDRPDSLDGLRGRLSAAAPGTLLEDNGVWVHRLTNLAASLRACAAVALLLVASVTASVVAVAARAGLAARREAIEIVHGLGGTDRMIAGRFARRVTTLAFGGAVLGVMLALPVLLGLADVTAPFQPSPAGAAAPSLLQKLPPALWALLPALPVAAAIIGWSTTQLTVRSWLGRLP